MLEYAIIPGTEGYNTGGTEQKNGIWLTLSKAVLLLINIKFKNNKLNLAIKVL